MKTIEWCSHCEQEVEIKTIRYLNQKCPQCGGNIKACNLCEDCSYQCEKQ